MNKTKINSYFSCQCWTHFSILKRIWVYRCQKEFVKRKTLTEGAINSLVTHTHKHTVYNIHYKFLCKATATVIVKSARRRSTVELGQVKMDDNIFEVFFPSCSHFFRAFYRLWVHSLSAEWKLRSIQSFPFTFRTTFSIETMKFRWIKKKKKYSAWKILPETKYDIRMTDSYINGDNMKMLRDFHIILISWNNVECSRTVLIYYLSIYMEVSNLKKKNW